MLTEIDLLNNDLFQKLDSIGLESDEYVIMGSGVMFALGIRPLSDLDDIDLLVTDTGWEKVKNISEVHVDDNWKCEHIYLFDEKIEIYNGWGPGEYIAEDLIGNSLKIGHYNFASVEDVIRWKKELGRDKDLLHVEMIMDYLNRNSSTV